MKIYTINQQQLEFDETLDYFDFWLKAGQPMLANIRDFLAEYCSDLESGSASFEADSFRLLTRWTLEAPRKRHFRDLRRSGFVILTGEHLFEEDGGEKIIDGLENTGKLAAKLCEIYGVKPVEPIKNQDPFQTVKVQDVLDGTA